jgi:hypothetical protein
MHRIFGLGLRGVMGGTSVALPSADWGKGASKNALSAVKGGEIVPEVH